MKRKILILSDLHIPFQDDGAVRKAMEIGKRFNPDTVVLNGDVVDFGAISKFVKSPKERDLKKELDMTNKFLKMVRQKFPLAKLIYKSGNHEERLLVYLWTKAEAFADLPELTLPSLLHFKENRIEYSPKENVLKFGDLSVIHGHEIKGTLSTYPARTGYQSAKTNVLFGHCHRESSYTTRDVNDKVYHSYSTGCLSKLHADFSPHNEWTHGIALIEVSGNGEFEVQLKSF